MCPSFTFISEYEFLYSLFLSLAINSLARVTRREGWRQVWRILSTFRICDQMNFARSPAQQPASIKPRSPVFDQKQLWKRPKIASNQIHSSNPTTSKLPDERPQSLSSFPCSLLPQTSSSCKASRKTSFSTSCWKMNNIWSKKREKCSFKKGSPPFSAWFSLLSFNRLPFIPFPVLSFTFFSLTFQCSVSSFVRTTCSLSVIWSYLALRRLYPVFALKSQWTRLVKKAGTSSLTFFRSSSHRAFTFSGPFFQTSSNEPSLKLYQPLPHSTIQPSLQRLIPILCSSVFNRIY